MELAPSEDFHISGLGQVSVPEQEKGVSRPSCCLTSPGTEQSARGQTGPRGSGRLKPGCLARKLAATDGTPGTRLGPRRRGRVGSQGCCLGKLSEEKERPVKQKEEEGRAGTGLSADPEILGAALARASVGLISAISPAGLPGQACDWRRNTLGAAGGTHVAAQPPPPGGAGAPVSPAPTDLLPGEGGEGFLPGRGGLRDRA